MPNFRFRAIIDIDVQNADTEASAREKAFAIMSAANTQPTRGRAPSGPKASVTGVRIEFRKGCDSTEDFTAEVTE